jgi:NADH-ubiquinone oxidoreductase chain 2
MYQILHYINNKYYTSEIINIIIVSSILSLIIGTILGLNQVRIKRLLAYSTISHIGFILLALSINSVESIQSFIFYIVQYSFSNLNTFFIILAIGYNLYYYINKNNKLDNLQDKTNSPIQLISQLKGYYYINPILALSLSITLFSFAGIPPLIGFFGKLYVISSALQNNYIFLALILILTSVIGAIYYLNIIKLMFFEITPYKFNLELSNIKISKEIVYPSINYISNSITITISIFTLIISLFMLVPNQILH